MTRVYQSAAKAGLRVLVVGAGTYPHAKVATDDVPALKDLTSVTPSSMTFVKRLLTSWRASLAMDLLSVDVLLSDPAQPGGAVWPGFGVPGEAPRGQALEPATMGSIERAVAAMLKNATSEDGLLLLFCGHGFSRGPHYFAPSDFGGSNDPWSEVVDLDGLALGLEQEPPRTQWLFWDCCANIPPQALDALGAFGKPIIRSKGSKISAATATYGTLARCGFSSAPLGEQAFGIPDAPSRFIEMLIEAIDSAGATKRSPGGIWWVDDRGILDAVQTYIRRCPNLKDRKFYQYVIPLSLRSLERIRFRKLEAAPMSLLITASAPKRTALKAARVTIIRDGADEEEALFIQDPPGRTAVIYVPVPALQHYNIKAVFNVAAGQPQLQSQLSFADLPLAEDVEFKSP